MLNKMRVVVIGAGPAGLCSARNLLAHGIKCDVMEMQSKVGGTWVYSDNVGKDEYGFPVYSAMYKDLRANLPKEVMSFPDFSVPEEKKTFLTQPEYLQFLEKYATHFNISEKIKFNCMVTDVRPTEKNNWRTTSIHRITKEETVDEYDAVMVCSGHHNNPTVPKLPGQERFKGTIIHSHEYRSADAFKDQNVLVIGAGASGLDLTLQTSTVAKKVVLSHHVKAAEKTEYPKNVEKRPDIAQILGDEEIEFKDGSRGNFNSIILCTGYSYNFPFLHESTGIKIVNNQIQPLYKHMIHIDRPTLCFIGVPYNTCAIRMSDLQARYFCKYLTKAMELPSKEEMRKDTERDMELRKARGYGPRQAHYMGPEQQEYYDELAAAAKVESIPPVIVKLRDESVKRRYNDLATFREDSYKIVDENTFIKVSCH